MLLLLLSDLCSLFIIVIVIVIVIIVWPLFIIVIVIVMVIIVWPLQSVHSREVDEDEIEAEEALRERDERIRELEVVIMRQVRV